MAKGLFITGTGTDVGKTYVTGLIVKKLQELGKISAYYKAAMSGNDYDEQHELIPGDAMFVKNVSEIKQDVQSMCPYVYEVAVSPHLASRIEKNPVNMAVVRDGFYKLCDNYEYITVEGSGGIICPIRYDEETIFLEDIVKELQLPCLMIADAGLGTINNVVLTYQYMKQKGITCKGIIFNNYHPNDVMEEDNMFMCEELTGLPVIACVKPEDKELDIEEDMLLSLYEEVL